ncbi:GLPGLI family protein [Empedobacter brevis]|uniref:GLPGLI family protein n=1 Tax=Empedobacter brevis TaxID=247 RepID=UPI002FE17E0E
MKSINFLYIFLFFSSTLFAQKGDFVDAVYSCSLKFDIQSLIAKIPKDNRKEAEVYLKHSLEKGLILDYSLNASDSISIFKLIPKISNSQDDGSLIVEEMLSFDKLPTYKFTNKKEYLKEIDVLGKHFLIKEPIPLITWEIQKDEKYILSKKATKAIGYMGNQNVIAWFYDDIKISDGPYLLHGLPGLIAEAEFNINNVSHHYILKSLSNKRQKIKIKVSKKSEIITNEELRSRIRKLQQEARENSVNVE